MIKFMPDLSQLNQAIYQTAKTYPNGTGSLGKDIGIKERTFDNKCNPNSDHKLTLSETIKILQFSGNPSILSALLPHLKLLWVKKIDPMIATEDMQILSVWADWELENAETGLAIRDAFRDNVVTQAELDWIKKELNDTFVQEMLVLQLIEKHLLGDIQCPLITALKTELPLLSFSDSIQSIRLEDNSDLTGLADKLCTTVGSLKNKIDARNKKSELNIHEVFLLSHFTDNTALVDYMAQQSGFVRINIAAQSLDLEHHELLDIWVRSASKRAETVININKLFEQTSPDERIIQSICHSLFEEFHHGYALLDRINDYMQQPSIKPQLDHYY